MFTLTLQSHVLCRLTNAMCKSWYYSLLVEKSQISKLIFISSCIIVQCCFLNTIYNMGFYFRYNRIDHVYRERSCPTLDLIDCKCLSRLMSFCYGEKTVMCIMNSPCIVYPCIKRLIYIIMIQWNPSKPEPQ